MNNREDHDHAPHQLSGLTPRRKLDAHIGAAFAGRHARHPVWRTLDDARRCTHGQMWPLVVAAHLEVAHRHEALVARAAVSRAAPGSSTRMPAPARRCGRAANWAWALTASAVAIVLASLCAAPRARAQTVCNPEYTGGPRTHPIDVDLIGGRQRAVEGAVTLAGDPLPAGLVADRAVLLDVYHAMWGTSWQCCLDWTTEPDPCKWVDGMVMCATDPSSGEPRVTQLSLRYRGVGGTIPASIGGLSELTVLDLTGNGVGGTLPPSIGNLTKLVVLDMTSNGLQGGSSRSEANVHAPFEKIARCCGQHHRHTFVASHLCRRTHTAHSSPPPHDLVGQLPDTFGRMSQLNYFSMLWNSLSGERGVARTRVLHAASRAFVRGHPSPACPVTVAEHRADWWRR